jgi:uncharacterized protein YegL
MNDLILRQEELIDNPTARVAVALVLDTSYSMNGAPIGELNRGVAKFFEETLANEVARFSAEVCIVKFGGTAELALDFKSLEEQTVPTFSASGGTPMGEAVSQAIEALNVRKREYQNAGVDYYQPIMVIMSDGAPTDSIDAAERDVAALVSQKKLSLFCIGIGKDADMATLQRLSPGRTPLPLKELNFEEFFVWLSASVARVSASIPGEDVPIDVDGIKGWANI